jgi:hypothetical protein
MMNVKYLLLPVILLLFFSCYDDATISVTNHVGNVSIEKVSYGDILVGNNLLPGESTSTKIISERWDNVKFPMSAQLQFYMVRGANRVFLKSKEVYVLNAEQHLSIVINDDTEVINPMKSD